MKLHHLVILLLCLNSSLAVADPGISQKIDADTWRVISQSVKNADIIAMGKTYHPDAVVVSSDGTAPISKTLIKWGEGMKQAAVKGTSAQVSFRFKSRNDGESTAFETGIFEYISSDANGKESRFYMNFETLLVNKDGRWLFLMERQLNETDQASWLALQP